MLPVLIKVLSHCSGTLNFGSFRVVQISGTHTGFEPSKPHQLGLSLAHGLYNGHHQKPWTGNMSQIVLNPLPAKQEDTQTQNETSYPDF